MRSEGTQPALLRYCAMHMERLRTRLPKVLNSWHADDLHDVRVACRRLKSAIEPLKPLIRDRKRKPLIKALRKIRKTLGPLRDLDVMSANLSSLQPQPNTAQAAKWVADRLAERQRILRQKIGRKLKRGEPLRNLKNWTAIEADIAKSLDTARVLVVRRATDDFQAFCHCADLIVKHPDAAGSELHALRISAKKLRYRLELAEAAGHALAPTTLARFKQLQDTLGQWHDFIVLSEQSLRCALDAGLASDNAELFAQVLKLSEQCAERARQYLAQFREFSGAFGNGRSQIADAVIRN